MTVAMATWLPATPRTAFRVHAFPLAIADPKPQPHSATLEASLESAALSAEGLPSCAATKGAVRPFSPADAQKQEHREKEAAD